MWFCHLFFLLLRTFELSSDVIPQVYPFMSFFYQNVTTVSAASRSNTSSWKVFYTAKGWLIFIVNDVNNSHTALENFCKFPIFRWSFSTDFCSQFLTLFRHREVCADFVGGLFGDDLAKISFWSNIQININPFSRLKIQQLSNFLYFSINVERALKEFSNTQPFPALQFHSGINFPTIRNSTIVFRN